MLSLDQRDDSRVSAARQAGVIRAKGRRERGEEEGED